eukprot:m.23942 g.23942  ORF g.23942 m.23942 type:complete len:116 (+) comp4190_c0_seq1:325-672(+)
MQLGCTASVPLQKGEEGWKGAWPCAGRLTCRHCTPPHTQMASKLSAGDVVRGVLVRTKIPAHHPDGTRTCFSDNAVVLVDKTLNPIGKRISGPVCRSLARRPELAKIIALAKVTL